MVYERNTRGDAHGDDYNSGGNQGYGRDYTYSSARDYQAAGRYGNDGRNDRQDYGARDYGNQRYGQRDQSYGGGRGYDGDRGYEGGRGGYGASGNDYGRSNYGRSSYGQDDRYGQDRSDNRNRYGAGAGQYRGSEQEYHGSYGSGSRRFEDFGSHRHDDDDNYRDRNRNAGGRGQQGYGRQPQGYDYEDRGFLARAGDEVRSWFGDEDAERRREFDSRQDQQANHDRDNDYHSWRRGQIDALDRDYHEYRQENRTKFENEFSSWRSNRQTQRDSLNKVEEHMDVVGSDGEHVGTVDKVRGDRIILTKNDVDAGGRHHSIPSNWLQSVDGKVTLSKTAAEAKKAWRDEERSQAMFGEDQSRREPYANTRSSNPTSNTQSTATGSTSTSTSSTDGDGKTLNKSFSGTY
ncbi:DUF2171 domain-containing protein [Sphingomonas kyungheensis]|uniref:DUF2171 domain-containing protein n=1 Tax=Sphingomonas kyungheensis TaxID=1069987 RepID=A0ABU8GYL1_9SPHN